MAKTESTDPKPASIDRMRELAKTANERKTIYPALEFTPNGDKTAEGFAFVKFRENGFSVVTNPKATGDMPREFYVIHVHLLRNSDFGQQPGIYQLQTAAANSALTDGILKIWQRNNENLKDVMVSIETYNYVHTKHGKTRGYRVEQIKALPSVSPS